MESVARLIIAAETPLAAQVGIATGLVVVGDLLSTGEAWEEEAVVGDTPNRPQSRWRSPGSRTSYPVGSTSNPELCRATISGRKSRLASWTCLQMIPHHSDVRMCTRRLAAFRLAV